MTIKLSDLQQSGKTRVKVLVSGSSITEETTVAVAFTISKKYNGNDVVLKPGETSGVSCAAVTEQGLLGVRATASVGGTPQATLGTFLNFDKEQSPEVDKPLTCP